MTPPRRSRQFNARSQVNRYDNLNRLVQTDVGAVSFAAGVPSLANRERTDSWQLDLLGNWAGGAATGTTGPPTIAGIDAQTLPQDLPADWGRLWINWNGGSGNAAPWAARLDEANPQNQITELNKACSSGMGAPAACSPFALVPGRILPSLHAPPRRPRHQPRPRTLRHHHLHRYDPPRC